MEVENLTFNIRRTGDAAGRGTDRLGSSLKRLKKSSESANKGLGSLLHTITRLAKMMMLRQAIRGVMKALSEGMENAYKFNSLAGGEMSAALDALKSASHQSCECHCTTVRCSGRKKYIHESDCVFREMGRYDCQRCESRERMEEPTPWF